MDNDIFERLVKDQLFYGACYIDPEKDKPLDPKEVVIEEGDQDDWVIVDGFFQETHIWVRKR